jgi:hypothetical protein
MDLRRNGVDLGALREGPGLDGQAEQHQDQSEQSPFQIECHAHRTDFGPTGAKQGSATLNVACLLEIANGSEVTSKFLRRRAARGRDACGVLSAFAT